VSAESNQPRISSGAFDPSSTGVWREIHYLDSETNYREYLPAPDRPAENPSELIMTDDASTSILNTILAVLLVMFMASLFIVLLITSFDF